MTSTEADDSQTELEFPEDDGKFLHKISEVLDTELTLLSKFTATVNMWASFVLLVATSVLYVTAFATVHWAAQTDTDIGLWLVCQDGLCDSLVNGEIPVTSTSAIIQGLSRSTASF